MTRTRFKMDPTFERELLSSDFFRDVLLDVVPEAASRAADLAPDDPRTPAPDLHTSVFGDVALGPRGWRGRVGAEDYKAPWFEEGASGVTRRPFLRPAVEEVVGPIEPSPEDD